MSIIRHITVWIAVTVTVMFVLPFAVAGFASECSGNGIVHDIVLNSQSDIFCHTWIPLWQEYTADVESSFGVVYSDFLQGRGYSSTLRKCGLSYMPQSI